MKSRLLTRFTSWFFNTSPEWVAPDQKRVDSAGMPLPDEQQAPQSESEQGDGMASDSDPDQQHGADR